MRSIFNIVLVLCVGSFWQLSAGGAINAQTSIKLNLDCIDDVKQNQSDNDGKLDCARNIAPNLLVLPVDHPDAMKILNFLETIDTGDLSAETMNILALSTMAKGNPGKASELYLNLILTYPKNPNVSRYMIGLARAFREAGEFKQAMAQLNSITDAPAGVRPWIQLEKTRVDRDQGNTEAAMDSYRELLDQADDPAFRSIVSGEIDEIRLQKYLESGESL